MARFVLDPFRLIRAAGTWRITDNAQAKLNAGAWITSPAFQNSMIPPSVSDTFNVYKASSILTGTAGETINVPAALVAYVQYATITESTITAALINGGHILTPTNPSDTVALTTAVAAIDTPADTVTVTSGTITPTLPAAILALTPAGYWKQDEGSGTTATDSSGSAIHGAYTGITTWIPSGIRDGKTYPLFDASSSVNTIPDNNAWSPATQAISVFFIYSRLMPGLAQAVLLSKYLASNYEWSIDMNAIGVGNDWTWGCVTNQVGSNPVRSSYVPVNSSGLLPFGGYHAYCVTIAGGTTSSTISLYRDSNTPLSTVDVAGTGSMGNGTAPLRVGNRELTGYQARGVIAHVAVFPSLLNTTQINTLMAAAIADGWI